MQEVDLSKYNYLKMPVNDSWGVLMRKDSPLAQKDKIHRSDLMDIPLIVSRQAMTEEMVRWFGEDLEKLNITATYDLIYNASVMVREEMGYIIGFDNLIYTGENSDLCFRPLTPPLSSQMYVIWRKYQMFTPVAALMLEELKKRFAN